MERRALGRLGILALATVLSGSSFAQSKVPNRILIGHKSGELRSLASDGTERGSVQLGPRPHAMAFDRDGYVWVGMRGETRGLIQLDEAGNVVKRIPLGAGGIYGVTAAPDGSIWYIQSHPNSVVKVDAATGDVLNISPLSGRPRAITSDWQGDVWVALREGEGVVERFHPSGAFKQQIQVQRGPTSLSASVRCCLWVSNHRSCTIQCIGPNGAIKQTIGFKGFPEDIAVDGDGVVWVTIPDLDVVYRYSHEGEYLGTVAVGDKPMNVAIDGYGNAWVVNQGDGTVTKVSREGEVLQTVDVGPDPVAFGDFTGFAITSFVEPRDDTDEDGYQNRNEIVAGSNPMDPADIPSKTVLLSHPTPGQSLFVHYQDFHNPLDRYVAYLAWEVEPTWNFSNCVPCDPRQSEFRPSDRLWRLTVGRQQFYPGFRGRLDELGRAVAEIPVPANWPVTDELYVGFITLDKGVGHVATRSMAKPVKISFLTNTTDTTSGSGGAYGGTKPR